MTDFFINWFYRIAAKGYVPRQLFERRIPSRESLPGRTGPLSIEIVSHCWNYAHLLRFQLSSLVLYPPKTMQVTMTVIYSPEDKGTADLLAFYGQKWIPNVTWNWVGVDKSRLFRRAIGRNMRAKETRADWIFFNDCDQMFYHDCLDQLGERLQGRRDVLVFPEVVHCCRRIHDPAEVLTAASRTGDPRLVEVDPAFFQPIVHKKAVGPLQVVHGDVARAIGYCESLKYYQTPCQGFGNTYEDRAIRWLLGTHGIPVRIPHMYRIEHHHKGRYESGWMPRWLRPLLSNAGRKDMLAKLRPGQTEAPPSRRAA